MPETAGCDAEDLYKPRLLDVYDESWESKIQYGKAADFSIDYVKLSAFQKEARKEMLWIQIRRAWLDSEEKNIPFKDLMNVADYCRKYKGPHSALTTRLHKYRKGIKVNSSKRNSKLMSYYTSESMETSMINFITHSHRQQQTLTVEECLTHLKELGASPEIHTRWFMDKFLKRWKWVINATGDKDLHARQLVAAMNIKEFYMRLAWERELSDYGSSTDIAMDEDGCSEDEGLLDPGQLFNMDEAGLHRNLQSNTKFVVPKGGKVHGKVLAVKGKLKTVAETMCADGTLLPPFILVTKAERLTDGERKELNIPEDWEIQGHDNSWMSHEKFMSFLEHFDKSTREKSHSKRILIMDNARAHKSAEINSFCRAKNIAILDLPPNCTHFLQPCDVGLFANWKSKFRKQWSDLGKSNTLRPDASPKQQRKHLFNTIKKTREAVSTEAILQGFKASGIYPLNPWAMYNSGSNNEHIFGWDTCFGTSATARNGKSVKFRFAGERGGPLDEQEVEHNPNKLERVRVRLGEVVGSQEPFDDPDSASDAEADGPSSAASPSSTPTTQRIDYNYLGMSSRINKRKRPTEFIEDPGNVFTALDRSVQGALESLGNHTDPQVRSELAVIEREFTRLASEGKKEAIFMAQMLHKLDESHKEVTTELKEFGLKEKVSEQRGKSLEEDGVLLKQQRIDNGDERRRKLNTEVSNKADKIAALQLELGRLCSSTEGSETQDQQAGATQQQYELLQQQYQELQRQNQHLQQQNQHFHQLLQPQYQSRNINMYSL